MLKFLTVIALIAVGWALNEFIRTFIRVWRKINRFE